MDRPALRAGTEYEASLDDGQRRRGAHYTPYSVARWVAELALARCVARRPMILDPTCGGGVFLIAALDALVERGMAPREALGCVSGVDIDQGAVHAARSSLRAWRDERCDGDGEPLGGPMVGCGDVTTTGWLPLAAPDIVLGNPPFRARLRRETSTESGRAVESRDTRRRDQVIGAYTDLAVLLWHAATNWVRPSGVVAMILPRSMLAARDAEGARRSALSRAGLSDIWIPEGELFAEADVRVVVPVLVDGASHAHVQVWTGEAPVLGPSVEIDELNAGSWSALAAAALGVPQVGDGGAALGTVARATAGFRDVFYAVSALVREGPPRTGVDRVATTAMVDVGAVRWGRAPVRIGGRRWDNPVVSHAELNAVSPSAGRWVERQRAPKVLVATQTRVIESGPDLVGDLLPLTPLISVIPREKCSVWELVAALSAPPATAWALRMAAGTALSADALKLSARQVLDLPVPPDEAAWRKAADRLARGATVLDVAAALTSAWGEDQGVTEWWSVRAEASMRRASPPE